ncbi:terminase small subunit [Pseudomonas sp. FIP_A4]|uniref:terminase small subunit n=1 Tax=Pseudomonas sp. FIP_A4 TaxID=3070684 RepID=UPI002FD5F638
MELLTKSEFAARMGWSKPYVSKLGKQSRLVLAADGRVDVLATQALLKESADPSKAGVADRHQRDRIEKGVSAHVAADAPPSEPHANVYDFQKSRAQREYFLAQLAESEARKSAGELVERLAVENAAYTAGRLIRDLLLGVPKQISPALAAITDPWELERELTGHLRRVLEDASRLSQSDLERALSPQK